MLQLKNAMSTFVTAFNFLLRAVCVCVASLVFSPSVALIKLQWAEFSLSTARYKSHHTSEWMIAFGSLESAFDISFYSIELLIFKRAIVASSYWRFPFDQLTITRSSVPVFPLDYPPPAAEQWLQSLGREWRDLKRLKLSCQPTATDYPPLFLFSSCESIEDKACPVLIFPSQTNLPHSLSIIYILSSIMWGIFGYLHTLTFVIVKSALHSVKEDVRNGPSCFRECIFRRTSDVTLTARGAIHHQSISNMFLFHLWTSCHFVPELTPWWEDKHVSVVVFLEQAIFLSVTAQSFILTARERTPGSWMFLSECRWVMLPRWN